VLGETVGLNTLYMFDTWELTVSNENNLHTLKEYTVGPNTQYK